MAENRFTETVEQVLMSQSVADTNLRFTQTAEQVSLTNAADVRVTAVYMAVLQSRAGRLAPTVNIGYSRR